MTKTTPPPWEIKWIERDKTWPAVYQLTGTGPLTFGMDGEEGIYARNEADLLLINAAPEMFLALKQCHADFISKWNERDPHRLMVEAAIAKARGAP